MTQACGWWKVHVRGKAQEAAGRRARAQEAAAPFAGVVPRRVLRLMGITRHHVRAQVTAERWETHGHQTIAMNTAPLTEAASWWRAIWEVGYLIAVLDGVSALKAAGLKGYHEPRVHVSIPHGCRPYKVSDVTTHQVIDRQPGHLIKVGVPRTGVPVAVLHAADWATSDRQAALLLCMVVQQRLATAAHLDEALESVTMSTRRLFVVRVVTDISAGAQALGELDFAELCRNYGLPEPSRQCLRTTPSGRIYLDVEWEDIGLVVEIDGVQHRWGLAVTDDNQSRNEVGIGGKTLLRLDLIGMRLTPDAFMDQVCRAHARLSASRAS